MRLSLVLFFKRTVPGHIFRGKRRLVKPVSKRAMNTLIEEYEQQEANMLLLRHPYLTREESAGHAKALGKHELFLKVKQEQLTALKMKPHVTLEDRLLHLRVQEKWD